MVLAERITPLSGILAGFALAVTVSLLLHKGVNEHKRWYETWAVTNFGIASILLTTATFALGFLLLDPEWFAKASAVSPAISNALFLTNAFGVFALLFGYIFFMAGVSLVGFWHSTRNGWIILVVSVIASALSLVGLISMIIHIRAQQAG